MTHNTTKQDEGYCIYSNRQSSDLSLEHIIPLSLGGNDSLCIKVDRKSNSGCAAKADAALANDFNILFDRAELDKRGNSNKPQSPIAKNSRFNGRKVQVRFEKDGMKLFDVVSRRDIPRHQFLGKEIEIGGIGVQLEAPLRFVAKVALSAGYFAYGNDFKEQVDHEQLRIILESTDFRRIKPDVRCFDRWQTPQTDLHRVMWLIANQSKNSCVILTPGYDCFGVAVGLLGSFIGFMNVPALGHKLKNEDDYDLGHVISIHETTIQRRSFRSVLAEIAQNIEDKNENLMAVLDRLPN